MKEFRKKEIELTLAGLEGKIGQIREYLEMVEDQDGEEGLEFAWDIITSNYSEDMLMEMEEAGLTKPDSSEDPDDEGYTGASETDGDDDINADGENDGDTSDGDDDREDSAGEDNTGDGTAVESNDETDGSVGEGDVDEQKSDTSDVSDDTKKESSDEIAGVSLPAAGNHAEAVIPEEGAPFSQTSLEGMAAAEIKKEGNVMVLQLPAGVEIAKGPVYVLPADTGQEVELRVMELRAATDENLHYARRIQQEIVRAVAEERKIRDGMHQIVGRYKELCEDVTESADKAALVRQNLSEGVARAERFLNEDMVNTLQQRAHEATNDFYEESKDHYNDLFRAAVKRYKQFTEAAMEFQDKMADENSRNIRSIEAKVTKVTQLAWGIIIANVVILGAVIVSRLF